MQALKALRAQFSQGLKDFASSSSSFKIVRTIPQSKPPSSSPINTLYVLDSSFNPPSKAHLALVKAALRSSVSHNDSKSISSSHPPRVLFLLATVNADKKPKPADFEDRLVMMTLMAEELHSLTFDSSSSHSTDKSSSSSTTSPTIDIGITKEPYFTDKASSIAQSHTYTPDDTSDNITQIHITGFDTLTRIFTPKYYPNHDPPLSALEPFLSQHRIHATIRVESTSSNDNDLEDEFGTVEKQKGYVKGLAEGDLADQGMKREWARQVDLAVDESGEADGVSSTKARECVKNGKVEELSSFVGEGVKAWIEQRGLYKL